MRINIYIVLSNPFS